MFLPLILIGMTAAFSALGWALKNFTVTGDWIWIGAALLFAIPGNTLYIQMLRHHDLGLPAVLSSLTQIVIMTMIGRLYFGVSLTTMQMSGIGLALAAMTMVLLPST